MAWRVPVGSESGTLSGGGYCVIRWDVRVDWPCGAGRLRGGRGNGREELSEFGECAVVTGEGGAERAAEGLGDLFEAHLAVVSHGDDGAVVVGELFEGVAEAGEFGEVGGLAFAGRGEARVGSGSSGGERAAAFGFGEAEGVCGPGSTFASAGFVADAVHGDAEEPGFEAASFGVAVGGGEFLGERDEDGLGDFFGGVGVVEVSAGHGDDAAAVGVEESAPGVGVARGGAFEDVREFVGMNKLGRFAASYRS